MTYAGDSGGGKDKTAKIRRTLVAQDIGVVQDGSDCIRLDTGADDASAVERSGGGSLTATQKLFLAVGLLRLVVRLAKERRHDGQLRHVREHSAERDCRWLHRWQVVKRVAGGGRVVAKTHVSGVATRPKQQQASKKHADGTNKGKSYAIESLTISSCTEAAIEMVGSTAGWQSDGM